MYIGLGHLAAFVCELAVLAARGIEGAGVAAITALVSSAFFVSVGLARAWQAKPETYAPWDTRPQDETAAPVGQDGKEAAGQDNGIGEMYGMKT